MIALSKGLSVWCVLVCGRPPPFSAWPAEKWRIKGQPPERLYAALVGGLKAGYIWIAGQPHCGRRQRCFCECRPCGGRAKALGASFARTCAGTLWPSALLSAVCTFLFCLWVRCGSRAFDFLSRGLRRQGIGQSRQSGFMPHWSARPKCRRLRGRPVLVGTLSFAPHPWHFQSLQGRFDRTPGTKAERAERAGVSCAGTADYRKAFIFAEK